MQYVRKQEKVDAIQLVGKTTLEIDDGELLEGEAGDWLVRTSDGDNFIMSDEEFKSKYEQIKRATQPRAMRPDELFELYDEHSARAPQQPVANVHPNVYYPPQQQFSNLPPMIPSAQQQPLPSQPTAPVQPQKRKSKGLGGLFGGKKKRTKPTEKEDFAANNIQTV